MKDVGRARLIGLKGQDRIVRGKREARHAGISWTKMIPTLKWSKGIEPARLIIQSASTLSLRPSIGHTPNLVRAVVGNQH